MIALGSYFLDLVAALLAVPTLVFFSQVMASSFLPSRNILRGGPRKPIAVLIPAHNESTGLKPTLDDIRTQLYPGDRLVVVADNCTDDTAAVAASSNAEVTVRAEPTKIGKGYALDWGLNYLSANPPEIVIIIDADCRVGFGTIDTLAGACARSCRPVQSLYLMSAAAGSAINHQVAEFAWRLKNWIRPLGLSALTLPCQLMGTGMAFPWNVIRSAELSSGFIVEDLKLGLELALAGHPPLFCHTAIVTSTFPNSLAGAKTQRQRWEHGHIALVLTKAPALFYAAILHRDWNLLSLVLDLLVPPLALFGLILTAMVLVAALAVLSGMSAVPLILSMACLFLVIATTISAWVKSGRDILPATSLALVPSYFVSKMRSYATALFNGKVTRWIRADRT
jgi:cellulose synthase/poly-beta-1,6-N-acetylglucosamine synthase-like glycosyltransferase